MITYIIGLILFSVLVIHLYYRKKFLYWSKFNINQLQPSIPFGTFNIPKQPKNFAVVLAETYKFAKDNGWQDIGLLFLTRPTYFPVNLEYIKHILSKDFDHFTDRGIFFNPKEPLTNHLFALCGSQWQTLRTKLTPTFTSGKLKGMMPIFLECSQNLSQAIDLKAPVNIKDVLSRFTTDVIGSCAFGLDCKSFSAENSQFRLKAKKFFAPTLARRFVRFIVINFPELARLINFKSIPSDVSDFYMQVIKDAELFRRNTNIKRNDFLQLLFDLMEKNQLTLNEVAAQAFAFFLAGFETSSSTMTFALYELAKNQEIQEKVYKEIERVLKKHSEKITYESLKEMTYLEQVIEETLRKYPPLPFLTRKCVKDYQLPLKKNLIIEKGVMAFIPILGIHYDPDYYPNPEQFDPERFSEENKRKRHSYAYLPFGEGPRMCIGLRFGIMQTKVGLITLLKKYRFTVSTKTQEPITFMKNSFVLAAVGDIWLNAYLI